MSWNYERSKERVEQETARVDESQVEIERLSREMDLSNLSPKKCRIVRGVHIYADIQNLRRLTEDDLMRRDDFKRLLRYLHVLRKEQRHIIQMGFQGDKIQVQGAKFHGLFFKPYNDDATLAWRSVLGAIAFDLLMAKAVPKVFESYRELKGVFGLEMGDVLVTNVGKPGNRELLCIGGAANHAAKLMAGARTIEAGPGLFNALPEDKKKLFTREGGRYVLNCGDFEDPEDLLESEKIQWDVDGSIGRMREWRDALPLAEMTIEEARERVDISLLGPKNSKVADCATFFVDIDGFTALVDSVMDDLDGLRKAVKAFHLFRYEIHQITENDFPGVAIQHQGDRLQAIVHLPAGDPAAIQRRATDICVSYQSSVEMVLNEAYSPLGKLHVAVGCSYGKTAIARLGVRGDLDCNCFGDGALEAERIQRVMKGEETGLDVGVYESLTDDVLIGMFKYDENRKAWVARGLTWDTVEDTEKSKKYEKSREVGYSAAAVINIGTERSSSDLPLKVTRPWGA